MLVSLKSRAEEDMERHTAQAGNQPVAAAEEARRATTGKVATFMMVVESV
jgi:hypothetical protein